MLLFHFLNEYHSELKECYITVMKTINPHNVCANNKCTEKLETIGRDKTITMMYKIRLPCALVFSILQHACKMWTLTAQLQKKIWVMKLRYFYKILGISFIEHITNEQVSKTISHHISLYEGPPDNDYEEEIDIVRPCNKIKWPCQNHPPRSCRGEEMQW